MVKSATPALLPLTFIATYPLQKSTTVFKLQMCPKKAPNLPHLDGSYPVS
jgi:hypothetical protein